MCEFITYARQNFQSGISNYFTIHSNNLSNSSKYFGDAKKLRQGKPCLQNPTKFKGVIKRTESFACTGSF